MHIRILPIALASIAVLGLSAPAHAGKGKKGGAQPGRVLAHLDRDHNGTIDGKEARRAQSLYSALASLDTDHNGQLSDSELAVAKVPAGGQGKGRKKKASQ